MGSPEGKDLFDDVVARRRALQALDGDVLHREDLEERLGVSKTTCHRIIRSLDDHGLLRRTADGYRLSLLGEVVTEAVVDAARKVSTARDLEPLLSAFESTDFRFRVSLFSDATITRARPDNPYAPIRRFMELLRDSNTLRSLDRTSIAPLHVEEIFEQVLADGLEVEAIYPRSVVEKLLTEYPEYHRKAADLGRMAYHVHDDIAFGMSLFDDRVGFRAYDDETGALLLFTDTGNSEASTWAADIFSDYRKRARNPDWFPDWLAESEFRP